MDDAYWSAVRSMRLAVADLLESLDEAQWDAPSLCPDWRVRDVAGHLALVPTITTWDLLSAVPRAGLDADRINTRLARRSGSRRPEEILAHLRAHAADRRTARVLDVRNSLFDVIVHSQDIAVPLARDLVVPAEHTRPALQRVWEMGWPFHAERRLGALTLTATDTDWTVGTGPEVRGTGLSLLLLLTGRTSTVLDRLSGPGATTVAAQASR